MTPRISIRVARKPTPCICCAAVAAAALLPLNSSFWARLNQVRCLLGVPARGAPGANSRRPAQGWAVCGALLSCALPLLQVPGTVPDGTAAVRSSLPAKKDSLQGLAVGGRGWSRMLAAGVTWSGKPLAVLVR
jgi:hypothetical protein